MRPNWRAIGNARKPVALPKKPPGGFTAPQYAKQYGISKEAAYLELTQLVATGKFKAHPIGRITYYTFNE